MRGYFNQVEVYKFVRFGGVDNCDYCDYFTHINEWSRPDGGMVFVCGSCEFKKKKGAAMLGVFSASCDAMSLMMEGRSTAVADVAKHVDYGQRTHLRWHVGM